MYSQNGNFCVELDRARGFRRNPGSRYSKDFWRRYAIPNRPFVATVQECIGDWIVFRQTGAGGYIAVAQVDEVIPDPERPGFSVALISGYLPFTSSVPFCKAGRYWEQQFRVIGRRIHIGNAVQGKPIRDLWQTDFNDITIAGFSRTMKLSGTEMAIARDPRGFEDQASELWDYEPAPRAIQELLIRRAFRDANFRIEVCGLYGNRCALTGVSIADGKLFDVEAAHVLPVRAHVPTLFRTHSVSASCSTGLSIGTSSQSTRPIVR